MELLQSGTTRREEKKERGNEWGWFSQMKTTLKRCGVWRNHEKKESLMGKAAEKDQTARETNGDCFSLEESTLLEKIEDVYENKISLRRVYEVKKVISEVKPVELKRRWSLLINRASSRRCPEEFNQASGVP